LAAEAGDEQANAATARTQIDSRQMARTGCGMANGSPP